MDDDVIEQAARVIEEATGLVGEAAWTAVTDVHVADEIAEALADAGLLAVTPTSKPTQSEEY